MGGGRGWQGWRGRGWDMLWDARFEGEQQVGKTRKPSSRRTKRVQRGCFVPSGDAWCCLESCRWQEHGQEMSKEAKDMLID